MGPQLSANSRGSPTPRPRASLDADDRRCGQRAVETAARLSKRDTLQPGPSLLSRKDANTAASTLLSIERSRGSPQRSRRVTTESTPVRAARRRPHHRPLRTALAIERRGKVTLPRLEHFPYGCSPTPQPSWAFSVKKTPLYSCSGNPSTRENKSPRMCSSSFCSCHLDRSIAACDICHLDRSLRAFAGARWIFHSVAADTHSRPGQKNAAISPLRCAPVEMTPLEAKEACYSKLPWSIFPVARIP